MVRTGRLLYKQPCDRGKQKTDDKADDGRNEKRKRSPFPAAGFFMDGKAGGGAGPVH